MYVAEGGFPGPVSLGERSVGWLEMEVQEWPLARVERSAKLLVILPQILSSRALLPSRLDLSRVAMFFFQSCYLPVYSLSCSGLLCFVEVGILGVGSMFYAYVACLEGIQLVD
jgi:hypothetical protein